MGLLVKKLDRVPPWAFRLLAARHGKALGPDRIAATSGLSRSTVQRISSLKTWAGVKVEVIEMFVHGCGFSITKYREPLKRLRSVQAHGLRGLRHMNVKKTAPLWKRGANGNRLKFISRIITQP